MLQKYEIMVKFSLSQKAVNDSRRGMFSTLPKEDGDIAILRFTLSDCLTSYHFIPLVNKVYYG